MKVIRERPCQRRHHRVTAPLSVVLNNGDKYTATDWSLGGLRIDGFKSNLPEIGEEKTLILTLPFQGYDITFDLKARVARVVENEKTVGFEYTEISERTRDLMSHFIEDLIRGQMGTFEDTICRIDIPVTPISTEPNPNPLDKTPIRRWSHKTIIMSCLYISLGFSVFGYIGILLYSNVMRMEVQSAVVTAPLLTLKMPVDGMLQPTRFDIGSTVAHGDEIARIIDPNLTARINAAEIKVSEAKDRLWSAKEKYRVETEKLKLYQMINQTEVDVAIARMASKVTALKAADAHFARISTLNKQGFSSIKQLEEAKGRQVNAATQLREIELEVEQAAVMNSASNRRHYNHKEFVVDLDILEIDLNDFRNALNIARRKLGTLRDIEASRIVRAPFTGRIVSLLQPSGVEILRNQPIIVIEQNITPSITAFLNQEEVLRIGISDMAQVYLPALNEHVTATVVSIDRNFGSVDLKTPRYIWRGLNERTAAVSLKLLSHRLNDEIKAGLPAVVLFKRRTTSDIVARMTTFVGSVMGNHDVDA